MSRWHSVALAHLPIPTDPFAPVYRPPRCRGQEGHLYHSVNICNFSRHGGSMVKTKLGFMLAANSKPCPKCWLVPA